MDVQEIIEEAKKKKSNTLDLRSRNLMEIPEEIFDLEWLEFLYLSVNKIKEIPPALTNLINLTGLYLSGNEIKEIPPALTNLINLTSLDLGFNQIKEIPPAITNLTNLTYLILDNNQIKEIPSALTNLINLTSLDLSGNPIEYPSLEIVDKGIESIRQFFYQVEKEGKDFLYEAKLLIVGESGAGKTTLANKIENQNYQLQKEDTTKGIEVKTWNFPFKNEVNFRVNIWDFGGQEIYHSTHQFFLTKRSLYCLVVDNRKEDTDFYYWLNIVELLSNKSPILIIKNEKQDRKREINQRILRGQFDSLKEILATNLADNRGLSEILNNIQHYIRNLPHIGDTLPKTWKRVREALEKDDRNYITLEEYLSICQENGFTKREDKLQLSGYLHDLGVCLHFQDEPLLNKIVILKPEWGTKAVYKVLDNDLVRNNFGTFTKDDLVKIWHEEEYCNMLGELLKLMEKFNLCYQIPNDNIYIAPQLLTENQPEYPPEYPSNHNNNLIIKYTYTFMPKGIISELIVAMHSLIYQQQFVWKSGVILYQNDTFAEVIEYYNQRKIEINVVGKHRKDLMTIVTYELDKIHNSYSGLKYQKSIPCNCFLCKDSKSSQDKQFYNFEVLQRFKADRQKEIQCQKSYQMVNVLNLIDDVIKDNFQDKDKYRDKDGDDKDSSVNINLYIDNKRTKTVSEFKDIKDSFKDMKDIAIGDNINIKSQTPNTTESEKPEIQELLQQLKKAIEEENNLHEMAKTTALQQVTNLEEATTNPTDEDMKNKAYQAKTMLDGILSKLPAAAALMTICEKIGHYFGL